MASWATGRPGWHIECTVIARKFLPATVHVQAGGSDLIFPHHEMGAGHAYALAGVPLARTSCTPAWWASTAKR